MTFGNGGDAWQIDVENATRIEAENFDQGGQGVSYNETTDGNSSNSTYRSDAPSVDASESVVGWFSDGEWLEYTVNVARAGEHTLSISAARAGAGGDFRFSLGGGTDLTGTQSLGDTGGWGNFQTRDYTIDLPAGEQVIRLEKLGGGGINVDWFELENNGIDQGTFANGGNAWQVNTSGATRIQAENFDQGGQGISYNETTDENFAGGNYRPDAPTVDTSEQVVGWFDTGEWLEYTINVAQAGDHTFTMSAARDGNGGDFSLSLADGASLTGVQTFGDTGGWASQQTRSYTVDLPAGEQVIRLNKHGGGGINIDWIELEKVPVVATQSTFGNGGNAWQVGTSGATRIQAENFDTGGQDVSYNETTAEDFADSGYRSDAPGVDVTNSVIAWFDAGEWLEYTVNIAQAGQHTLRINAARGGAGGDYGFSLADGTDLTGVQTLGDTGWGSPATRSHTVDLPAGQQVIRLNKLNDSGLNVDWIELEPAAADPGGPSNPNNLLANGDFTSNLDGWSQWNNNGLAVSQFRDGSHSSAGFSGGSLKVDFSGASGSNWWDAAAATSVQLANNTSYTLTFAADAAANRPLHVQVKRGGTSYSDVDVNLTSSGTQHTVNFTTDGNASGGTTNVVFFYGSSNVDFWIDSVSLESTGSSGGGGGPIDPVLSDEAIAVGFEQHAAGTAYARYSNNTGAQKLDWDSQYSSDGMNNFAVITDEESRSGGKSLKVTYPDDEQLNAITKWIIPDEQEYYLSYWVKFDDDFVFNGNAGDSKGTNGGKLPGLGAGDLCSGGDTCDGSNGFTTRYMWREDGRAVLYLYHMDKPGQYGEDVQLKDSNGNDMYFQRGEWIQMVQRVRINTGNQKNGSVDVWMNGEQVLSRDNIQFVNNGQQIDTLNFSTFHGGYGYDWWPSKDVDAFYDDFVVSTNASDVGLA